MAEKESKKRKRVSNGEQNPQKKVAFAAPEGSERVTVSFNHLKGLHPALLSSPGFAAPKIPLKAYTKPLSSKNSNNDAPKPHTHSLLLQSSEHPRLDYTATRNNLDHDMSHYIAVYDPTTKKLQVTPVHRLDLRADPRSEKDEEKKPRLTKQQQREALTAKFGTKKAKKILEAQKEDAFAGEGSGNKQKAAADVQSAIVDSMAAPAATALLSEQDALEAALASKPIPKLNLAAEAVEEVYTLNSLMPPQDAKLITTKEWQDQANAGLDTTASHRYPAKRAKPIAKVEDLVRLKALAYINCLLDFHSALGSAGKTGKKVPKRDVLNRKLKTWPEALISSIAHRFSTPNFELPKWHLERLYTHICALALYVDGYSTETKDLKEDLKVEQREIVQYFRELGCKVVALTEKEREAMKLQKAEASLVKMAKLKLPLDFPKVAQPRAGRRR